MMAETSGPAPFAVRVYRQGRDVLVAAADLPLLGRTFREGPLRLAVKEDFYGTEASDETTLVAQLRGCTVANLVGATVVAIAVKHGFVDPANVLLIEGVPHAQLAVF